MRLLGPEDYTKKIRLAERIYGEHERPGVPTLKK